MLDQRYRWKNKQIRDHVAVVSGKKSPTLLLKNARYLHSMFRKWMNGHIWIYGDRIVYTGDELPENTANCEVIDCSGLTLVPGYIEPHVHPFQLYNPQSFARYASQSGTTTIINDNLVLALQLGKKKAFSLIRELRHSPVTMYWWSRFDSQTELREEETIFSHGEVKSWLEHDAVLQGGELTGWPKLLDGDDLILHWMQEAKRMRKKIEGHFPGASEKTLAKMMLFGADCDHEAMTGEEVYKRLMQGYMVSLRHSSIRPDLPVLLEDMKRLGIDQYDSMFFNTDGSTPAFYENGIIDRLIRMAIEHGVPVIDAYHMASFNVAKYYNIEHLHGLIATGRVASINFLEDEHNPTPISVLSKGKWLKKDGTAIIEDKDIEWEEYGFAPLQFDWELDYDDLQFSMPFGIEMINDVITKPYSVTFDIATDELTTDHDESFLILIGRDGSWRINTMVKGFSNSLMGFASSFSSTGDIILIGKNKNDMVCAFNRMKELGGGIVMTEKGKVIHEIPLNLSGFMSNKPMDILIKEEKRLKELLIERGYPHNDPIYSLLFFSATHLPYIRITQRGIFDVMNKTVLFPTIMR
ncbi:MULTISPECIES: adenine deaminase C-terminal domain-containing protein [Heyndrickxia]|uniref:adenine deaminase n=1 Tax=Heyndrickxia sporothermodurans TaxID=46224 RepID=A0AB37HNL7_9BACI|nr:adenine deaminase C-terminal domain-containing protein [Heyndrickxia sporothermodurans]MBL5766773.1 adenine deaminase [Heyndrickxia sporothermodurans]MBL5770401.1 adenine deaminase [Heyndrickxia sporothermodurans]MBL5773951.1 adenine deaminase [Heyndrickxia sporothermodurans]MBL5777463.1 adenine deaminase [Heyndrickxia sporothermodurans]MBL5780974.1 adenine deaminase [Heyndrickxia sporothermodurans]